eukprot:CAMPEP_0174723112 /NCGR_PEP_ID=MMETSP1094-20130205/40110_1 /TAXON_ID=156173 /ORGANISM="Chrysochromulina brevifilum, Strain UTEX LB 985" /LENGTH=66 /DNA_ID=CAMNT_0015924101 /DNA_START=105 /DNA_END=305 /DNA_ORIENTATION=+
MRLLGALWQSISQSVSQPCSSSAHDCGDGAQTSSSKAWSAAPMPPLERSLMQRTAQRSAVASAAAF